MPKAPQGQKLPTDVIGNAVNIMKAPRGLSSKQLATLIVDALVSAELIRKADVADATNIAKTEIDVRKAMGDY
jgi:hypothetical protein